MKDVNPHYEEDEEASRTEELPGWFSKIWLANTKELRHYLSILGGKSLHNKPRAAEDREIAAMIIGELELRATKQSERTNFYLSITNTALAVVAIIIALIALFRSQVEQI
ncbi:MAG: hypothetical protein KKB59_10270 [Spirochaetes bacterium]|nr:hypothetical protein [Spirochaetota bacterium]